MEPFDADSLLRSVTAAGRDGWHLSRRQLLQTIALAGIAAGCSSTEGASPRASGSSSTTRSGPGAGGGADSDADLRLRIERASFGVTPTLWKEVSSVGFATWLDRQIASAPKQAEGSFAELDGAIDAILPERPGGGRLAKEDKAELRRASVGVLTARTVLGAAYAPDQLRQRMVDVLADRLHVSSSGVPELYFLPSYDRMLRENAFGRFADLLVEMASHPAMLLSLDNAASRADGTNRPNENFGRELMELHTVGVDGGYDETDVVEAAHVFSGWSLDRRTAEFTFKPEWHSLGPLAEGGDILGWKPKGRGEADGKDFLEYLARHPATAERLVHLLARRFVSEEIAADHPLVKEAVDIYDEQDTRLGPVVAHLLTSDRFPAAATKMLRRPIDMVATTLRRAAAEPKPDDVESIAGGLFGVLRVMGQVPYAWPAPDGYPTPSAAWSNAGAVISRWNSLITLAHDGVPGLALDPRRIDTSDRDQMLLTLCSPDLQLV
ncbi:MAG: DUF1800 domain-containing protein [Acidimicrobiales bacterium]|nr:DUF1800 domain-containing protein [Acidimicrobiales bacterium]